MPTYPLAAEAIDAALASAGVPSAASLVSSGLMPYARPYRHQMETLEHALLGEDVVVGTGTGSGKTEAFLLPVIARLVAESQTWTAASQEPDADWWSTRGNISRNASTRRADLLRSAR